MKTYKFKLYNHPKNKHLHRQINIAGNIYNHCIALHKRYYRLYGKSLHKFQLGKHITKLKKLPKYSFWNQLGSQAIQNIIKRIDDAYKLFFNNLKRKVKTSPPSFKRVRKYKSFTLSQCGYKLLQNNYIRIGKKIYRYFKSRDIQGDIKTLTVKRDTLGDIYIYVVTDYDDKILNQTKSGKSAGFDFGLKTFLTSSDNQKIESPLFFKKSSSVIKGASKKLSSKKKGSNNRKKARLNLVRKYRKISNQRDDYHWKLAHQLTNEYDVLCFENLNLKGMQKLYGKKINDLGFYSFLQKLKYIASKKDKTIHFIDRFYPSSKTCSNCSHVYSELSLKEREWVCSECNVKHDRDYNAAINIYRVGVTTFSGYVVIPTSVG